jgi:hypothetical protein
MIVGKLVTAIAAVGLACRQGAPIADIAGQDIEFLIGCWTGHGDRRERQYQYAEARFRMLESPAKSLQGEISYYAADPLGLPTLGAILVISPSEKFLFHTGTGPLERNRGPNTLSAAPPPDGEPALPSGWTQASWVTEGKDAPFHVRTDGNRLMLCRSLRTEGGRTNISRLRWPTP